MKIYVWTVVALLIRLGLGTSNSDSDSSVIEAYANVTDCGDGTVMEFGLTVSPYPLIKADTIDIWVGGNISFSEEAQRLTKNVTFENFNQDLRTLIFIDEIPPSLPRYLIQYIVEFFNNSRSSGHLVDLQLMELLYAAMGEGEESFPFFFGITIEEELSNPIFRDLVAWINEKIDTLTPLQAQFRMKQLLYDEELMCAKVELKTSKNNAIQYDPLSVAAINYGRVFETPKYERRDGVLECPADSVELTNDTSLCICPSPRAGPFCQFQCTKQQIDKRGGLCGGTQTDCWFTVKDYVSGCINAYNIGLLDGPLIASAPNLNNVNISWQSVNFTTYYQYVINIASAIDTEGEIQYRTFSVDGIRKNISVQELYENGFTVVKLNMYPYTNYTVTLRYATSVLSESPITQYNYAGSVVFTTPEVAPSQAPQVTAATLLNNLIMIEWLLPGQCPGPIRTYDVKVLCDAMSTSGLQPENSGNIFFDCGGNHTTNGTQLQANVPQSCQSSRHLKVQVKS
uniref:Uncharacterized protein n=1 Tax=Plectus sambesii TaxID=2011161 RepID=A0A914W4W7_9BILA